MFELSKGKGTAPAVAKAKTRVQLIEAPEVAVHLPMHLHSSPVTAAMLQQQAEGDVTTGFFVPSLLKNT